MHYFAGIFDAEGYVSLCPNGAFNIAIEMANENIPNLFKDNFQGSIYIRKRDKRKKTWIWKINSINDQSIFFINSIAPHSIVKINQLKCLGDYLDLSRNDRKTYRAITCSTIKNFKQPCSLTIENTFPCIKKSIEPNFFKWLAGFIDGDGNFVCNEYIDNRNNKKYFAHQLSISNVFLEAICHINDRIPGTIVKCKRSKNPLYTWSCKRNALQFVCENIQPFLLIKNEQCKLFTKFLAFPKKQYGTDYDENVRLQMYSIINQIKHLNSL